jgi:hypothetical protein
MRHFIKLTASYTGGDKNLINLGRPDSKRRTVTFMEHHRSDEATIFPPFHLDGPSRFITGTPLDYIAVYRN